MMSAFKRFAPFLRRLGSYFVTAIFSIALTLTALPLIPGSTPLTVAAPLDGALAQTVAPGPVSAPPLNENRSFVAIAVNRVGPAVVRIDTERTVAARVPDPFFDDPFFRRFFGENSFPQFPREFQQRGLGSGLIVDNSGIVLTNAHVVSGADTVTVTLKDGRRFEGEVKGVDEPSDLAVVKIEGQDLPIAPLGNSSEVQVGDWAIAVGNPLGLDNTVTLGIVSTLNRSSAAVGIPDKRLDFIQTDAAINPGNSGGPLVNERGEVIGINTAIRADAQGIGFAIPIDAAKAIKDRLASGERIPHPYIGISMLTITPATAQRFNQDPNSLITVPEVNGVLVMQIMPRSPAEQAGLRRGDVITAANGTAVTSAEQFQALVERSQIGQPFRLTVRRGNQTQQISVRPGELRDAG